MSCQGRPLVWMIVSIVVHSLWFADVRGNPRPPLDPVIAASRADAELTDVFFVDADRGWAVGEHGVVWHTADGGRNWRQQDSTVTCRLESVWFLDPQNGWAVGGQIQPYTHRTSGVVLRTRDGGRQWTTIVNPTSANCGWPRG